MMLQQDHILAATPLSASCPAEVARRILLSSQVEAAERSAKDLQSVHSGPEL